MPRREHERPSRFSEVAAEKPQRRTGGFFSDEWQRRIKGAPLPGTPRATAMNAGWFSSAHGRRPSLDLGHRHDEPEWLDGADLNPAELEAVLHDLATFNQMFLGHYPLLRWLDQAVRAAGRTPMTLVDIGCGYGDLLRAIRRWSRRRKLDLNLIGVDLNPETIRIARAATDAADLIDYKAVDVFELASATPVDLMISSLVTHHLSDPEITEFLRLMETTARRGWAISDLQRNRFLYHFIGLASRLGRFHPMITHDGQLSVARSLTRAEWQQRIAEAGISSADVSIRWFLFRFLIGRLR
jgi:2-polyprenyl-3-methyl-5-hydroxy-6-metoxy-1,4-benzoquinol methylase